MNFIELNRFEASDDYKPFISRVQLFCRHKTRRTRDQCLPNTICELVALRALPRSRSIPMGKSAYFLSQLIRNDNSLIELSGLSVESSCVIAIQSTRSDAMHIQIFN